MNTTAKGVNQNICKNITQIQKDLEVTLNHIFEQAGSNIQVEKQAEYTQAIENTKKVIEKFKNKYGCAINYPEKPLTVQINQISTKPNVTEVANQSNSENVPVDFVVSKLENILVVPTTAIKKQNNTTGVFVGAIDQPPKFVPITTGVIVNDRTEVKTGLDGTENILIECLSN